MPNVPARPGMVQFTYAQLMGIWIMAGGNPTQAAMAAAIAMAESSGMSTATNHDANGSVDRGLWQINSIHGAQSTFDVMGNARAAVAISGNGSNWQPWATYNSGAYRQFYQPATTADMNVPINATNSAGNLPTPATLTSSSGPSGFDCIAPWNWGSCLTSGASGLLGDIVGAVLNPLINIVAGVMGMIGGATMVLFGIIMIVMDRDTGSESVDLSSLFKEAGATMTGAEKAALTRQQTMREQQARREELSGREQEAISARATQAIAGRSARQTEEARQARLARSARTRQAKIRAAGRGPGTTRTKTTRTTKGNVTTYTTVREQINGQAKEYQK